MNSSQAHTNRAHREWAGSELVYNQHRHHCWDVVVTLLLHRLTGYVKEWGGLDVVEGVWCSLNALKPSSSSWPFDVETEMNYYLFSERNVSIIERALEIAAIFSHTNQRAAAHNSRKIVKTERGEMEVFPVQLLNSPLHSIHWETNECRKFHSLCKKIAAVTLSICIFGWSLPNEKSTKLSRSQNGLHCSDFKPIVREFDHNCPSGAAGKLPDTKVCNSFRFQLFSFIPARRQTCCDATTTCRKWPKK